MARADTDAAKPEPSSPRSGRTEADEVIPIRDLAPRDDVKGGRKIVLGEIIGGHRPKE